MPKINVTISVQNSGMEILQQLAVLIKAVKLAHANGATLTQALPADITALIASLPAIIQDAQAVKGDIEEDQAAFLKGVLVAIPDLYQAIRQ